jgi:hypothetical protein
MFRSTAAFLLSVVTMSLVQKVAILVQGTLTELSSDIPTPAPVSVNDKTDPPIINDEDEENNDDDFSNWVFGEEGCDEHSWPQTKLNYEQNIKENWFNHPCCSYEFQYIIFGPPEVPRPIRILVVNDIVDSVEDVKDPSNVTRPVNTFLS